MTALEKTINLRSEARTEAIEKALKLKSEAREKAIQKHNDTIKKRCEHILNWVKIKRSCNPYANEFNFERSYGVLHSESFIADETLYGDVSKFLQEHGYETKFVTYWRAPSVINIKVPKDKFAAELDDLLQKLYVCHLEILNCIISFNPFDDEYIVKLSADETINFLVQRFQQDGFIAVGYPSGWFNDSPYIKIKIPSSQ